MKAWHTIAILGTFFGAAPVQAMEGEPSAQLSEFEGHRVVAGELLVSFEIGVPDTEKDGVHAALGSTLLKRSRFGTHDRVSVAGGDIRRAIAAYGTRLEVKCAVPNAVYSCAGLPDDPQFAQQWALTKLRAPEAWDSTKGCFSAFVAVVDTGCQYLHEDLSANFAGGYDFLDDDADPTDIDGHGTHVCGIIAGTIDNGVGIAGVAGKAGLFVYRAGRDIDGNGIPEITLDAANDSVRQANDDGAAVIVLPWAFADQPFDPGWLDAVDDAQREGIVFVAAAGNGGGPPPGGPPGGFLIVASTNEFDQLSSFSPAEALAAPGENILSTWVGAGNNNYMVKGGTSFAAAHVAGAAALLSAMLGGQRTPASAQAIRDAIMNSAVPLPGNPTVKRLDLAAAINALGIQAPTDSSTEIISIGESGQLGVSQNNLFNMTSGCGRFVAFTSRADGLTTNDSNGYADVFVRDRITGTLTKVSETVTSAPGNGDSGWHGLSISGDGRYVAFSTMAPNMGQQNVTYEIILRDLLFGDIHTITVPLATSLDSMFNPHASRNGRWVAFENRDLGHIVGGQAIGTVWKSESDSTHTKLISGDNPDAASWLPSHHAVSANGRYVLFVSQSSTIVGVPSNPNHEPRLYRYDDVSDSIQIISIGIDGVAHAASNGAISANGRFVAMNMGGSFHVRDAWLSSTLDVPDPEIGLPPFFAVGNAAGCDISADGRYITARKDFHLAVYDTRTGLFVSGDVDSEGDFPPPYGSWGPGTNPFESIIGPSMTLSDDGRDVAMSAGLALVGDDTNLGNDIYLRTRIAPAYSNYGAGVPGTHGIPELLLTANPTLGASPSLKMGNSLGAPTAAVLFIGVVAASIQSAFGGTLLVSPLVSTNLVLPSGTTLVPFSLPLDLGITGTNLFAQLLEADAGAVKGVSFSRGLKMRLGEP